MPRANQLTIRRTTPHGGPKRAEVTPAGLAVIEAMATEGNDQRTIARALGIDKKTLTDLRDRDPAVAEAWERGHAALADELTHILLTHARNGNLVAAIFLTKARLGWRDQGPADGGPSQAVQVNINLPEPKSREEYMRAIIGGAVDG